MAHMRPKVGEYAIITNSKNEFLMVQFPKPSLKWHFPGGRLDNGEDALQGLIREVDEEVGLSVFDIRPVFTKVFDEGEEEKYGVFYTAKVKEPYRIKISDEMPNFKWFKKEDLDTINFWQPFYRELLENNL